MKTTLKTVFAVMLLTLTTVVMAGDGKYTVNAEKSNIKWKGEKVTGEHVGNVKVKGGSLEVKGGKLTGGTFEVDMTSITNTDLTDAEYNAKLVGHLKSDDFFGVEKYPTAKLVIKQAIHQGNDRYKIVADLTIKGVTKEVKFPAFVTIKDNELNGTAEIVIDRSEYNVRYGSGSFFDDLGDKTIYDNFTLNVSLVAKQ